MFSGSTLVLNVMLAGYQCHKVITPVAFIDVPIVVITSLQSSHRFQAMSAASGDPLISVEYEFPPKLPTVFRN